MFLQAGLQMVAQVTEAHTALKMYLFTFLLPHKPI